MLHAQSRALLLAPGQVLSAPARTSLSLEAGPGLQPQVTGHCQDYGTPSSELQCKTLLCSGAPGSPPAAQAAVGTSAPASSPMVPGEHTRDRSMHPAPLLH